MSISGALEADDLVLTRILSAPVTTVWAHLVTPHLLERWFGTLHGDPRSRQPRIAMTAESPDAEPTDFRVHVYEPSRMLTLSSELGEGSWTISFELQVAQPGAPAGSGATRFSLRHHDVDRGMIQQIGPGWEWYLDRLTAAIQGEEPPGLEVWESRYVPLGEEYAALVG